MISRCLYHAKCKEHQLDSFKHQLKNASAHFKQLVDEKRMLTLSLFEWESHIFMYYECINESIAPEQLIHDAEQYFEPYPGETANDSGARCFMPMYDIFHYNQPRDEAHWRRTKTCRPFAQIVRIKPEKVSSYIYYHYQLQEEHPGCGDKYGIIGIDRNLLFYYQEDPKTREEAWYKGSLATSNSPREQWQVLMEQHFLEWDSGEFWKRVNMICFINGGEIK